MHNIEMWAQCLYWFISNWNKWENNFGLIAHKDFLKSFWLYNLSTWAYFIKIIHQTRNATI